MNTRRRIVGLLSVALLAAMFALVPTTSAEAETTQPWEDETFQNWSYNELTKGGFNAAWVSVSPPKQGQDTSVEHWQTYGPKSYDYNCWNTAVRINPERRNETLACYSTLDGQPITDGMSQPDRVRLDLLTDIKKWWDVAHQEGAVDMSLPGYKVMGIETLGSGNSCSSDDLVSDGLYGCSETKRLTQWSPPNTSNGTLRFCTHADFIIGLQMDDDSGTRWSGWSQGGTKLDPSSRHWLASMDRGPVGTVGALKNYINSEIASGAGSDYYRYELEYALWYLDVLYGSNSDPISLLCIPQQVQYVCKGAPWGYGTLKVIPISILREGTRAQYDFCYPPTTTTTWEYEYECDTTSGPCGAPRIVEGPWAERLVVEDQSPSGVGKTPFTTQTESTMTPFGEEIQAICEEREASNRPCVTNGLKGESFTSSEMDRLETAAQHAANNPTPAPKVDLTAANKRALAEGRLVEVDHYTDNARIVINGQANRYMRRLVTTTTHYSGPGTCNGTCTNPPVLSIEHTYGDWEYANQPDMDIPAGEGTWDLSASSEFKEGYQVLVNHCNGEAFENVAGSLSIDNRSVTDSLHEGSYVASSAVSNRFTQRANRPWGDTGPTSETGFYDKVCSWQGKLSDVDGNETTSKVDTHTTNKFFRSGETDKLAANYYTPTTGGWIDASDIDPDGFTVTRWLGGTPIAGQFSISGRDDAGHWIGPFFNTSDVAAPTLKQWTLENFNSRGVAIGRGGAKQLFTSAIWATSKAKPQVLTVKWDFSPDVATVIPATKLGFTQAGAVSYTKETVEAKVRGQVWSSNKGATLTAPQREAYVTHTGSGTTNTLDVPTPEGTNLNTAGKWLQHPADFSDRYYVVDYRRSSTE